MLQNVFDQQVESYMRTNDNIQKITTGQGDDYTTGCLLDYPCFKEHYKLNKLIAVHLSKKQMLDDMKAKEHIILTGNLDQAGNKIFHY